jgi:glycosyltransferase involved in cell wall biosynthesis
LNAKKIDLLYLLQITPDSLLKMLAYRIGGGTGKIYLKLDLGLYEKNGKDLLVWNNMNFFLRSFHMLFKNLPSIYTVETKDSYNRLLGSYYQSLVNQKKLYLMPNGFDSEILSELNIVKLPVSEKQNIILTVGRIGTYQKNTELLLDILSRVNLKGWKVYIVGAIDKIFINNIESFYSQFPDKKDSVIFTGEISQRELYNYYNISRVFLLTSRHESYAFVLAEAAYMNNYIISTNVGIAPELLDYAAGHIVENNLSESFVNEIQRIINLSSQDLNQLIPHNGKQNIDMITWDWILKNNAGILKLIDKS